MSTPAPAPTPMPAPAPTSWPTPGPTSPPFAPIATPVFIPWAQYNTSELPDVQDAQFVQKIYPTDDELWFCFLFLFVMTQLFWLSFADFVVWSSGSVWGIWRLSFGILYFYLIFLSFGIIDLFFRLFSIFWLFRWGVTFCIFIRLFYCSEAEIGKAPGLFSDRGYSLELNCKCVNNTMHWVNKFWNIL